MELTVMTGAADDPLGVLSSYLIGMADRLSRELLTDAGPAARSEVIDETLFYYLHIVALSANEGAVASADLDSFMQKLAVRLFLEHPAVGNVPGSHALMAVQDWLRVAIERNGMYASEPRARLLAQSRIAQVSQSQGMARLKIDAFLITAGRDLSPQLIAEIAGKVI